MSNIIELSAFTGARSAKRVLPSENDTLIEPRVKGRQRGGHNMHTFVFRSYNLIVKSDEADLVRDVCFDVEKAQSKLKAIRRQLEHDRKHAAARAELLTSCETKLSAAIDAALTRTPASPVEVEPPVTTAGRWARRREFGEAMRRRIRIIALFHDLSVEEIKPALTLKHQEIAKFTEKHGVKLEWLLEGKGPIFERAKIVPTMSGAEFAAVLRTLPEAEAVVDLFLEGRSQ
jgi:DNA-binding transcriptional MerR regulator